VIPTEVRTERLLLRQWRADDAERMAEIYAEPRFLEHMPAHDLTATRAQLERLARNWREHGYSHWAVEETASSSEPVVVIAERFDAVGSRKCRLRLSRFGEA